MACCTWIAAAIMLLARVRLAHSLTHSLTHSPHSLTALTHRTSLICHLHLFSSSSLASFCPLMSDLLRSNRITFKTEPSGFTYIAQIGRNGNVDHRLEHLVRAA